MAKKKAAPETPSAVATPRRATVPAPGFIPPIGRVVRGAGIKVRATQMGYYDHARRRPGDVFVVADAKAYSPKWMEIVRPETPEKLTGAKAALEQIHDEIIGGRTSNKPTGDEQLL